MLQVRICPTHRVRYLKGSSCPQCPPKRGRDSDARAAQRRFRTALLVASDGRCAYSDADGVRCPVTDGLQAAHIDPYAADGNFAAGAMLCPTHHVLLDGG